MPFAPPLAAGIIDLNFLDGLIGVLFGPRNIPPNVTGPKISLFRCYRVRATYQE